MHTQTHLFQSDHPFLSLNFVPAVDNQGIYKFLTHIPPLLPKVTLAYN
jgi:hypothetical protein